MELRMNTHLIIGRNPVTEAIRAGRVIDKVLIKDGETDFSLKRLAALARDNKILVVKAEKKRLDTLAEGGNHQGVIAYAAAAPYAETAQILEAAKNSEDAPFIVICDRIQDPHNLGAIIRTAAAAGAHGVIISKHDSVGLTPTVLKTAAGAAEHIPIAKETNLARTIDELKKEGYWITGADASGDTSLYDADLDGAVAVVIGNEGEGLLRLIKEKCDFLVNIPMKGKTESLNASVAAALLMYEVARSRLK